jgi:hypothetical protein
MAQSNPRKSNQPSPEEVEAAKKSEAKAEQEKTDKAAEKAAQEQAIDRQHTATIKNEENVAFQAKLEEARIKKGYTPKAGTGKMFHVKIEKGQFDGATGDKVSQPTVSIMEQPVFVQWINNAARLGYSFKVVHDASPFHTKEQVAVIQKAITAYTQNASKKVIAHISKM